MKFILTILFIQLITFQVIAASVTAKIDSIEKGKGAEPTLIKMTNGEVVFLDATPDRKEVIKVLNESRVRDEVIRVEMDEERSLTAVQTLADPAPDEARIAMEEPKMSFDPSVVILERATTMFKGMRRDYQNESQCYNRAHIWAYEEFKRSGIKSMKLFLFFTSRYIRNYRYHWWFHVTPMALLTDGSWRTLDRRYTSGPLAIKTWTDKFIYSRRSCPVIYKYSEYRNHQSSQDCYLIPVSMYYWQPKDIRRNEQTGFEKEQFFSSEINHAYWEAF